MKKGIIITSFTIVFIMTLLLVQYKNNVLQVEKNNINVPKAIAANIIDSPKYQEDIKYEVNMANHERESITFIMNEEDSQYYQQAVKHYHLNPTSEYETMVNHCGSLISVIEHLKNNPTSNGEPWGKINIIKYTPEWKGIHILTEEERMESDEILAAMNVQSLNPLDDDIVDAQTEILIDGTGLGNNEDLMELIALAFGGNDEERPIIRSSKFKTTFHQTENESYRYLTESFFGFFPSNDAMQDEILVTQLQNNYPEEELDWWDAIERLAPRFPGDTYTVYNYENDLTTVCILRALTIENDESPYTPLPFEPDLDDERFYTTIKVSPKNLILSFNE